MSSADVDERISNVRVTFRGDLVATSDSNGAFMFKIPSAVERITMTLTPASTSQYNSITQTLTLAKDTTGIVKTVVKLLPRAPAVTVNSSEPSSVAFAALNNDVSMGAIDLPADAFYNADGEPVAVRLVNKIRT